MAIWIFFALMLSAIILVLYLGEFEERLILSVLLVNFLGTPILYWLGGANWMQPQVSIFFLDLVALIILTIVALRSKRFWPMPIAAFQIIPVLTFFVSWVGQDLKSYGLGIVQGAWSYPQIGIVIIAAIGSWRRRKSEREISKP